MNEVGEFRKLNKIRHIFFNLSFPLSMFYDSLNHLKRIVLVKILIIPILLSQCQQLDKLKNKFVDFFAVH